MRPCTPVCVCVCVCVQFGACAHVFEFEGVCVCVCVCNDDDENNGDVSKCKTSKEIVEMQVKQIYQLIVEECNLFPISRHNSRLN